MFDPSSSYTGLIDRERIETRNVVLNDAKLTVKLDDAV